jgi:septum formation protein
MQSFELQPGGLILASGSPRRKEIFTRLFGPDGFTVADNPFDEASVSSSGSHEEYVARVSSEKCRAFVRSHHSQDVFVVTADTLVVCGRARLGKPANAVEAADMLRALSGRKHRVLTAVSMGFVRAGRIQTEVETTDVWFARLDEQVIDWYVSTGEPLDKAGAYGIQDLGAILVSRIRGCYQNVVGLPIRRMMDMMEHFEQDPGSTFMISDHLPWKQEETMGGSDGGPEEKDQGHSQNPATV